MVTLFDKKILSQPHRYITNNFQINQINYFVTGKIKFGTQEVELQLFEEINKESQIEILLGLNFLDSVKPWKMSSNKLTFRLNGENFIAEK